MEDHFRPLLERLVLPQARLLIVTGGETNSQAEEAAKEVHNNLGQLAMGKHERTSVNGFSGMSEEDWDWILN
jgi:hypothetical protein